MKKNSQIKRVLDKRINETGQFEYFIEWKNSPTNSWVPIINLKNELELLADYEVEVELKKKTKPVEQQKTPEKQEKIMKRKKPLMKSSSSSSEQENNEYEVEEILEKKLKKNVLHFKVKWKGYPLSECTWEPLKNLANAKKAIAAFEEKNMKQNEEIEEIKPESEKQLEGTRKKLKPSKKIRKQMEEEIIEPLMPSQVQEPIKENSVHEEEKIQLEIEEQPEVSEKGNFNTDEPDKIISARPTKGFQQ